jgi:ABC-type branched-subunit amino acid transport system substrate-binding protein
MKKALVSLVMIVLVAGIAITGCAGTAPPAAPTTPAAQPAKTLDIGLASPLTGPYAFLGTQIHDGTLLAIDDQNKQGGVTIGGENYTLNPIIRDTKQDLVLAKSVSEELVFDKGVKILIGPFIADAIGAQAVTEPNKVIAFIAQVTMPGMSGPGKPYTFFWTPPLEQMYLNPAAYVHEFYPEAKTVVSLAPDIPTLPGFLGAINAVFPQYGLEWKEVQKFPVATKDLTPMISRVLASNPDIVDLCATGGMAGLGSLSIKQLRQAGFTGPIMAPASPSRIETEEVIPKEYLNKIVLGYHDIDSPLVTEAWRGVFHRYQDKFQKYPEAAIFQVYNPIKAFFEFLDGQPSMDTTAWMEGFGKYHWQSIFGFEGYCVGKKIWGIDRRVFGAAWESAYKDGKLVTDFTAPLPYDLFVEK